MIQPGEVVQLVQEEAAVLTVARGLVGQAWPEAAREIVATKRPALDELGPTAMDLVKDTLARGVVLELVRRGGHRVERTLKAPAGGRLWERQPPPSLSFGGASMQLLLWLASAPLSHPPACSKLGSKDLTAADDLLFYLACSLCHGSECADAISTQPAFRRSAFSWLAFPDLLSAIEPAGPADAEVVGARFGPGADPLAHAALEAIGSDLARRWTALELRKRDIVSTERMQQLGAAQKTILSAFFSAVDRAARRDLATSALDAAVAFLTARPTASTLTASLDPGSSLGERSKARRGAGAFAEAVLGLRSWDQQHRLTRFIDDGYAAAQLVTARWESLGERGWGELQELVTDLGRLPTA